MEAVGFRCPVRRSGRAPVPYQTLYHGNYEYTSVEIGSHIVPVDLHQATVSQVVRLLDSSRNDQGKDKNRRGSRGQR